MDEIPSRPRMGMGQVAARVVRRTGPLVLVHIAVYGLVIGAPLEAWLVLPLILYARGMTVTVGYHRYFAHRSFKTSRAGQFALACMGCLNVQNGPLWWAAHHRRHHRHSDGPGDVHSPIQSGFFWAHCGWLFATLDDPDRGSIRDLRRFPELVWLERVWLLPAAAVVAALWFVGGWGTVCIDFCLSAVIVLHVTFAVNSFGHLVGSRSYETPDRSRNSFVLAVLTLGEGWHNNHHRYPYAAQAGLRKWELDASFRVIRLCEWIGLVWDVRRAPVHHAEEREGIAEPVPAAEAIALH